MGELWTGLVAHARAARPARRRARAARRRATRSTALRRLQYALHLASEHAYGVEPPRRRASAHAELARRARRCARRDRRGRGGGRRLGRGRRRAAPARVARRALPRPARAAAPRSAGAAARTLDDRRRTTGSRGRSPPSCSRSAARSRSSPARRSGSGPLGGGLVAVCALGRRVPSVTAAARQAFTHLRNAYARPAPRGGARRLPRPTLRYRLKAWRAFQRALDPLAPPKPLRPPRRR